MILGTLTAPLTAPVQHLVARASARAQAWSADSQQVARHNALVANTALAARRRDREDVEGYFAALERPTNTSPAAQPRPARR